MIVCLLEKTVALIFLIISFQGSYIALNMCQLEKSVPLILIPIILKSQANYINLNICRLEKSVPLIIKISEELGQAGIRKWVSEKAKNRIQRTSGNISPGFKALDNMHSMPY